MDYAIIGGDERFAHLAGMLQVRGLAVCTAWRNTVPGVPAATADLLRGARRVITNVPGKVSLDELRAMTGPGAVFLTCGPCAAAGEDVIDLWADEDLQLENAWLTAEGAISAAMRASAQALRGSRCLVIGWGRIGRALTELLVGLGAGVVVASRSEAHRNRAVQRGARAVATGDIAGALPGISLIFNTAPELVLDGERLAAADPEAMIIDLASPPYGIDLHAAWNRGLRAWREPGLPGRYCPESAARALLNAIDRRDSHV